MTRLVPPLSLLRVDGQALLLTLTTLVVPPFMLLLLALPLSWPLLTAYLDCKSSCVML
jgi:hypothetical protein